MVVVDAGADPVAALVLEAGEVHSSSSAMSGDLTIETFVTIDWDALHGRRGGL
jgi:hypothetical protein